MIFAAFWNGPGVIFLGLLLLVVAFVMRRSGRRAARQRVEKDVAKEVRNEFLAAERAGQRRIEHLEVRLHEYGREIDAQAQTRIATLRQLIEAADQSAKELRELLAANERHDDHPDETSAAA